MHHQHMDSWKLRYSTEYRYNHDMQKGSTNKQIALEATVPLVQHRKDISRLVVQRSRRHRKIQGEIQGIRGCCTNQGLLHEPCRSPVHYKERPTSCASQARGDGPHLPLEAMDVKAQKNSPTAGMNNRGTAPRPLP
jgi:hypothetical protein